MLALCQLLVEPPKALNNCERSRGNRIGKVTTWRRHGAYNGDGAFADRAADAPGTPSTLVEEGKSCAKVGRETCIGRHFTETTRNLTERLSPSRGGISHHSHVVAHVPKILGKADAGVNRGLACSDGHVRSVGYKRSALHDGLHFAIYLGF